MRLRGRSVRQVFAAGQAARLGHWRASALTCAALLAHLGSGWASGGREPFPSGSPERSLEVDVRDERISLEAHGVSAETALSALAAAAGLRLRIGGGFGAGRGDWSFRELGLKDALGEIVGDAAWVLLRNPEGTGTLIVRGTGRRENPEEPWALSTDGLGHRPIACAPQGATQGEISPDSDQSSDDDRAVEALGETVREGSLPDARDAIAELELIGSAGAVAQLQSALGAKDPAVRADIVRALGRVGTDEAVRALGQALYGDSDTRVRMQALATLKEQANGIARLFVDAAPKIPGFDRDRPPRPGARPEPTRAPQAPKSGG